MNYTKYVFSFLLIIIVTTNAIAQIDISNDSSAVRQVLITMFDGMREGDSTKVSSVFRKDVRMFSSSKENTGESVLHEGKLIDFLKSVGTPHEEVWDEKIYNVKILIDDDIAQVWADYSFYLDKKFSHCGVDAFQMVRENNKWLIISLIDTRRKEGCE
jgi:hypothetical protein